MGVIATVSLLGSVSPLIRYLIKVPREFINDYLFNFPDTSIAWSFVLALLAAALTARKRIAWLLLLGNMILAAGLNAADIAAGDNTAAEILGENLGFALHIVAIVLLVLAYREFWAKVRRGALVKAAGVLVAGDVVGILVSWGLVELFPGTLARPDRLPYVANRVVGFALADPDLFTGRPHVFLNAIFGLFGALALIMATIVLFNLSARRTRSPARTNRPSAGCSSCTARTTPWATSPPAATSRWFSPRAGAPPSPTGSRSASAWPAATRSAIPGRGPRPPTPGWVCAKPTAGRPASWAPAPRGRGHIAKPA